MKSVVEYFEIFLNRKLKKLRFNYCVDGQIMEVLSPTQYKVDVDNYVYTLNSIYYSAFEVGQVVLVEVINNNWSRKIVKCPKIV